MNTEFDYDLAPDQWETLKALRLPAAQRRILNRFVVDSLVTLQLAVRQPEFFRFLIWARMKRGRLRGHRQRENKGEHIEAHSSFRIYNNEHEEYEEYEEHEEHEEHTVDMRRL